MGMAVSSFIIALASVLIRSIVIIIYLFYQKYNDDLLLGSAFIITIASYEQRQHVLPDQY
jgi:hypothetical protein